MVRSIGRDVPDDVAPAPVLALLKPLEWDLETRIHRVRVRVPDELVPVTIVFRGADEDGPVEGKRVSGSAFAPPELDDFDGVAAWWDSYGFERGLEEQRSVVICGDGCSKR